jgi:hypothetical protein
MSTNSKNGPSRLCTRLARCVVLLKGLTKRASSFAISTIFLTKSVEAQNAMDKTSSEAQGQTQVTCMVETWNKRDASAVAVGTIWLE